MTEITRKLIREQLKSVEYDLSHVLNKQTFFRDEFVKIEARIAELTAMRDALLGDLELSGLVEGGDNASV